MGILLFARGLHLIVLFFGWTLHPAWSLGSSWRVHLRNNNNKQQTFLWSLWLTPHLQLYNSVSHLFTPLLPKLRLVVWGEPLLWVLVLRIKSLKPWGDLHAAYGPTEKKNNIVRKKCCHLCTGCCVVVRVTKRRPFPLQQLRWCHTQWRPNQFSSPRAASRASRNLFHTEK